MSQSLNGLQHDYKINSDIVTVVSTLGVTLVIVSLILITCYIILCIKNRRKTTASASTIASRKQTRLLCSHECDHRGRFTQARTDHSISTASNTNNVQINLPKAPKTNPQVYDQPNSTTDAHQHTSTCSCARGEHIMYNGSSRGKGPTLHVYINQQVRIVSSERARKEVNGNCEGEREYTNVRAFEHPYLRYGK